MGQPVPSEVATMKRCTRCRQTKHRLSEYTKCSRNPDGLQSWCKECFKAYARGKPRLPRPAGRSQMSVEIPAELHKWLRDAAACRGERLGGYVNRVLEEHRVMATRGIEVDPRRPLGPEASRRVAESPAAQGVPIEAGDRSPIMMPEGDEEAKVGGAAPRRVRLVARMRDLSRSDCRSSR